MPSPDVDESMVNTIVLAYTKKGLFWGLISKEASESALMPFAAGTFLLRFSAKEESGAMAVAYKQSR